jgi:peptidyl-dipeptidase Dcp
MRRQLRDVERIAAQPESPKFDNTIAALERSGQLLTRVLRVFAGVTSANTNDTLQAVQTERRRSCGTLTRSTRRRSSRASATSTIAPRRATPDNATLRKHPPDCPRWRTARRQRQAHPPRLIVRRRRSPPSFNDAEATKAAAIVAGRQPTAGLSEEEIPSAGELAAETWAHGAWIVALQNTTQ